MNRLEKLNLKILLIYPYFLEERIHEYDISVPPIGLYYVGAVLKDHGYDADILNWHHVHKSPNIIQSTLIEKKPDVIGFSILHANRWGGIEIAAAAKKIDPDVKTVFGGIGASFLWHHLLKNFPAVDYIVLGEGEYTFLSLVDSLAQKKDAPIENIRGIAFRKGSRPHRTKPAEVIRDLDQLPMPAKYFKYRHISFTRGCPGNCIFCGSPMFWGHRVRTHSPGYFVDQLELLYQKGIASFYFSDDMFTFKKEYVLAICREIISRKLDITWVAISRVTHVNNEVLSWMRRAGCTQISYGIESGSEKIRRQLNKPIRNEQIKRAFAATQKYGILPRAYIIYGSPGESYQTIQETIDLIHDIKPLSIIFYILDIFPGTKLYEDFKTGHGITDDIWLDRVEDIMYFETDPDLTQNLILEFGKRLRSDFYENLPGFVAAVKLIQDSAFSRLHADFYSRLGLTFTHGEYAAIAAIKHKARMAESLFRKALSLFPDMRAYLGLGLLYQKQRRFRESMLILRQGLEYYPENMDLNICQGVNFMNMKDFADALEIFLGYQTHGHVIPYIVECFRQMGDHKQAQTFRDRMERK